MSRFFLHELSGIDYFALAWFFICWAGYSFFSERSTLAHKGLVGVSHIYRLEWAQQMLKRDQRIVDVTGDHIKWAETRVAEHGCCYDAIPALNLHIRRRNIIEG